MRVTRTQTDRWTMCGNAHGPLARRVFSLRSGQFDPAAIRGTVSAAVDRARDTPATRAPVSGGPARPEPLLTESEEHTSELQSRFDLVCRLLLEKKNKETNQEQDYIK